VTASDDPVTEAAVSSDPIGVSGVRWSVVLDEAAIAEKSPAARLND
jgi:hypothetical protein